MADKITDWLMDSDPSIRFQVMRDLLGAEPEDVRREQERVGEEGWGARLLFHQDPNGGWGVRPYVPKWTSTTYTMLLLRRLGLPPGHPRAIKACQLLLDQGFYSDGGINYFGVLNHSEVGITGIILSVLAYFQLEDDRVHTIAGFLVGQQLEYGGWNSLSPQGETEVCFHTTICVLEALREYETWNPKNPAAIAQSQKRGREFLLKYQLYKMPGMDVPIHPSFIKFSFPPRYHYDVMRALDFFQDCRVRRDPRMEDAVGLVISKHRKDGTWPLQQRWPGKTYFEMEEPGRPSRWNTLRALRILKWWYNE